MSDLRVGFLGAGLIATFHSRVLAASGEAVVRAGVYDVDRERASTFVAASGGVVCASEEEVLDGCDAVYVCTWTSEHPRLVAAAIERGLAVFCEKPLATSLPAARQMATSASDAGITTMVGLVLRRSPTFNLMRSLVNAPEAGRIQAIVFRDDQYLPTSGMYASTWRGEVDKAGAGTLLEHSIHDVDLLEWMAGPIVQVTAQSANFHGIKGIEDTVVATMRHTSGATSSLTSVWHDIDQRPSLRRVEVICERRWVALEGDWDGPVRWMTADDAAGEQMLSGAELLAAAAGTEAATSPAEMADAVFVRAALAREQASPSFVEAVAAHEIVDAVYRSAAAGGSPVVPREAR